MNLLDRTFTDTAWYWPKLADNFDGTKTYASPIQIVGRWNDSPTVLVTPNEDRVQIGARFQTDFPIREGGWLLMSTFIDPTMDPTTLDPHANRFARELGPVVESYPFDRSVTYYTGNLK